MASLVFVMENAITDALSDVKWPTVRTPQDVDVVP